MREEVMNELPLSELDEYAARIGIDTTGARGRAQKVEMIREARERTAEVHVLGMTVVVPIRRMHDKRVTDRLNGQEMSDAEFESLMVGLLGRDQMDAISAHVSDEDGTVDLDAYGMVLRAVITSDAVKNFGGSRS